MLRAVMGRRVGGILVPFNRRDRYRTWWDDLSDFVLGMFPTKYIFFTHSWARKLPVRLRGVDARVPIGQLDNLAFEVRREGLYGEGDLGEGDLASYALDLVRSSMAAWSGGFWDNYQNTYVIRSDGYVQTSVLLEGSVCHARDVASAPGSTNIEHLRVYVPEIVSVRGQVERGVWMPPEIEEGEVEVEDAGGVDAVVPPVAPASAVESGVVDLQRITLSPEQVEAVGRSIARQMPPVRSLPEQRVPLPVSGSHVDGVDRFFRQAEVSSQYDHVSLFGMALHHRLRSSFLASRGQFNPMSQEFMAAFYEKASAFVKEQGNDPVVSPYEGVPALTPLRAISPDAYRSLHHRVPHLRADEVAQSDLTSYGDELVPVVLNSVAWYYFRMDSRVLGLFSSFALPNAESYDYPVITGTPRLRLVREPSDASQFTIATSVYPISNPTTSKVTFTPGRVGRMFLLSKDLLQKSGINAIDAWAEAMRRMVADGLDDHALNGDESATATNISHYGTDPTDTEYDGYLAFDGLREIATQASDTAATATLAAETPATLGKLMGTRGIIGRDIANLVQIVDPGSSYVYDALSEYEKANEVGPQNSTLLNGQVDMVKGVPIVVSDQLEYANASGQVEDSHDGTKGQQVQVHTPGIMVGYLQDVMSDAMVIPWANGHAMWVDVCLDIKQMEAGHVAHGYNTTV